MATKLTLVQVMARFPGAWEAEIKDYDQDDVEEYLTNLALGECEFWEHEGVLYARTWWLTHGWHYGEWKPGKGWFCPDTGEIVCPWVKDQV